LITKVTADVFLIEGITMTHEPSLSAELRRTPARHQASGISLRLDPVVTQFCQGIGAKESDLEFDAKEGREEVIEWEGAGMVIRDRE
jgi:hypothetical protein